ncbi:hypothetical protein SISSUDRAFT_310723 [Sistotremastrum suecicum HHB10207 ss-3]|uniref:Uncharacterized protein n=1 Tax=Sistotremastrum suecicum HHB10207 ss-3 TaxID=1314776 RepID=A0A165ZC70_9AGAM|nr:hypothetical protein SISSUDRAFT_310723 [Sistotremastrum suecicum HHB10207 ss-3]
MAESEITCPLVALGTHHYLDCPCEECVVGDLRIVTGYLVPYADMMGYLNNPQNQEASLRDLETFKYKLDRRIKSFTVKADFLKEKKEYLVGVVIKDSELDQSSGGHRLDEALKTLRELLNIPEGVHETTLTIDYRNLDDLMATCIAEADSWLDWAVANGLETREDADEMSAAMHNVPAV